MFVVCAVWVADYFLRAVYYIELHYTYHTTALEGVYLFLSSFSKNIQSMSLASVPPLPERV